MNDTTPTISEAILDAIEPHYMALADGLPYTARELAKKSVTYRNLMAAASDFAEHITPEKQTGLPEPHPITTEEYTPGIYYGWGHNACVDTITKRTKEYLGE